MTDYSISISDYFSAMTGLNYKGKCLKGNIEWKQNSEFEGLWQTLSLDFSNESVYMQTKI